MRRVNTIWELEPELRNKIWAETLEEILKQFEAMPHISDEAMLEGLGINRQMIYKTCPWLHPANRKTKIQ